MPPLSLCVAGAGRAFQRLYLPALRLVPELRLVAAADPDPATLTALPPGATGFESLEAALDAAPVDAVLVASPPTSHVPLATVAASRGIPVLLEKPPALSLAELQRLEPYADLITPAFPRRLWPSYRRLAGDPMAAGDLVLTLITDPNAWGPTLAPVPLEFDVLPHLADIACWVRGEVPVTASAHRYGEAIEVDLAWDNASPVHCRVSHGTYREYARTLAGKVRLGGSPLPVALFNRLTRRTPLDVSAVAQLLRLWSRRVAGETGDLPMFADGLASVAVVDAVRGSLESPAPVEVPRA